MNPVPYTIKTLHLNNGILDNCVDVTYIIHLEGNGRELDIMKQLEKVHPTSTVHIVYNKGFRKYDKGPDVKDTVADLIHCYLWIFEHYLSTKKNANKKTVLILEDDFIFSEEITHTETRQKIEHTLDTIKNERFVFRLGCIPFTLMPRTKYTYVGISLGAHCSIYNEKCMQYILSNRTSIKDWDTYLNMCHSIKQYIYYNPLCYQLFPKTENSENWGNEHVVFQYLSGVIKKYIQILQLDKQVEPGYSISYKIALLVSFIMLCLVVYIIYYVFGKVKSVLFPLRKYTLKIRSSSVK